MKTAPGADCTIKVNYKSGPSKAGWARAPNRRGRRYRHLELEGGNKHHPGYLEHRGDCQSGGTSSSRTIPFEVTS